MTTATRRAAVAPSWFYRFICRRCDRHFRAAVITDECPHCSAAGKAAGLRAVGDVSGS
jgi:hypothetical protein